MRMTNTFTAYCLSVLLIADFCFIITMLMMSLKDRAQGGFGHGIMTTYSIAGLLILTIIGVAFLVSYFRKSFKAIEMLTWLMIVVNSFIFVALLSILISSLLQ